MNSCLYEAIPETIISIVVNLDNAGVRFAAGVTNRQFFTSYATSPVNHYTEEMKSMETKKQGRIIFNIGFKMIAIISLIFAVSFAIMIYIATDLFKNDMTSFIENNNHKISSSAGQSLEIYIKNIIEKGYIAADTLSRTSDYNLQNTASNENASLSALFLSESSEMFYMAILEKDADGNPVIIRKFSDEQFFLLNEIAPETVDNSLSALKEEVLTGFNLHISVINPSEHFKYPVTAIIIPYQAMDEQNARSVLYILLRSDMLRSIVQSSDITTTFIISERGNILIHPDLKLVLNNTDISRLPIFEDFHKNALDNGQKHYTENGVAKIGSYQRINFSGFSLGVVTTVDTKRALAAVYRVQKRNLLLAIIIVTAVILFLWFFAKSITVPVRKLVKSAKEIEGGNYKTRVKPLFNDEIGLLTNSFNNMSQGLEERERIKTAFGKFVNPEIAERVAKEELSLGGELKHAAVFFSDIRSFTAISEKLSPHQVVEFLNEYMTLMVDCIDKTHGVVDKFIGDAIMALWGTPISRGNDTENAVNGALMMREALREFNSNRGSAEKPVIRIGCGINTGPLVAGQIGSLNRMEYTVIGDTVNLASRIESLNKPFHTDILVSSDAYALIRDIYIAEPMKKIHVKGKTEPQQIYAIINRKDAVTGPRTLSEMRSYIGVEDVDLNGVNADASEEKYTIVE